MRILKIEPFSGISGDMFLGALAPLLDMEAEICALPAALGLGNVQVSFEDCIRSSLHCRRAVVHVHDEEDHSHAHDHGHGHSHAHDHPHTHGHGHHHHRAYRDIVHLLQHADLPAGARDRALEMFRLLGETEAAMHGSTLDDVHFHEVGGEDSIVDIVGAALLLDRLAPERVLCSPVCTGSGFVKTAHGRLPVPAPATISLLAGMPTFAGPVEKEMTTPTGAVILRALTPTFQDQPLILHRSALGAGSRDLPSQPNALRLSLGETTEQSDRLILLQTNIDNMSGEMLGAELLDALLNQGALDAWLSPILMKRGRPAHMLEVLCPEGAADALADWILQNTRTLGVRRLSCTRRMLERRSVSVATPYGDIRIKVAEGAGPARGIPEAADCHAAAAQHGVSAQEVQDTALARWRASLA